MFGDTDQDVGYSVTVDSSGNIYTTGLFQGTVDFDPGAGTANLTSNGLHDVFVLKLNSSGNYVWAKNFGGTDNEKGFSVAVDSSGNVYTTGDFQGTADFDPGPGTANLTSNGGRDVFVSKLDSSGNYLWAKSWGSAADPGLNADDTSRSVAVDSSGNVYTTGYFQRTVDFDPGAGTTNLTVNGNTANDVFVSKLDSSGDLLWVRSVGGTSNDLAQSVAVDSSGNVYTTGYFYGTTDFDPGAGTAELTSSGGPNGFVLKLDSSGNYLWAKTWGGAWSFAYSMAVDSSGNVYASGNFQGTVDFDPGAGTANLTSNGNKYAAVLKLDSSGNYVWAKSFGGTRMDFAWSVAVDSSGNVYTTGFFQGTADFDPGAGTTNLLTHIHVIRDGRVVS